MTVEESNKMIAEFMGYGYHPNDTLNGIKGVLRKEGKLSLHAHLIDKSYCPEYHTSWDWLHPVIDKIRSLWNENSLDLQLLEEDSDASRIRDLRIWADIDSAYQYSIQFIQWYNTNNNSSPT